MVGCVVWSGVKLVVGWLGWVWSGWVVFCFQFLVFSFSPLVVNTLSADVLPVVFSPMVVNTSCADELPVVFSPLVVDTSWANVLPVVFLLWSTTLPVRTSCLCCVSPLVVDFC